MSVFNFNHKDENEWNHNQIRISALRNARGNIFIGKILFLSGALCLFSFFLSSYITDLYYFLYEFLPVIFYVGLILVMFGIFLLIRSQYLKKKYQE